VFHFLQKLIFQIFFVSIKFGGTRISDGQERVLDIEEGGVVDAFEEGQGQRRAVEQLTVM
jgi:hypothetical protein